MISSIRITAAKLTRFELKLLLDLAITYESLGNIESARRCLEKAMLARTENA